MFERAKRGLDRVGGRVFDAFKRALRERGGDGGEDGVR
jgi:hypothetical protein